MRVAGMGIHVMAFVNSFVDDWLVIGDDPCPSHKHSGAMPAATPTVGPSCRTALDMDLLTESIVCVFQTRKPFPRRRTFYNRSRTSRVACLNNSRVCLATSRSTGDGNESIGLICHLC